MTTTRRRSSVGSAAASAAAADPPAASTPTSVRSSSRRRTSVARRDSPGGLDLGLLGRPSVGGGGGGGGGDSTPNSVGGRAARAFRFFEDEEEEGGVLVLGGWRVRPLHVMGSLFLLVLFAVLTLLTLYPGVSEGLSKDLSFTGPKRVGRGGAGQRGNVSMDDIAARVGSPELMALLEDYIEQRFEEVERDKDEIREDVDRTMSLVNEMRAVQAEGALSPGAGGAEAGAADREAFLAEVEAFRAQIRGIEEVVHQALGKGTGLGEEALLAALEGLDVPGTVAAVAEMKEQVAALDAHRAALEQRLQEQQQAQQEAQPPEGLGGACEARIQELGARVEALQALVAGREAEAARVRELLAERQPAQALVEEARTIRAAVEGEVAGLKQALAALAASSSSATAAAAGGENGVGVDLGAVRAAVAEAAAAAQAQLEAKESVEALLAEARAAVVRLEEANANASAVGAGAGAGAGVGEEKLGELEAELARVKAEEAALAQQVAEQGARVAQALEEVQAAVARQKAEAEAAAAAQAQAQEQPSAMDPDAIEAMVEAEVEKRVAPLASAAANATAAAAAAAAASSAGGGGAALDEEGIKAMVQDALQESQRAQALREAGYGATDFAAARLGGRVVRALCSPTYTPPTQLFPSDWYERLGYASQVAPRAAVLSDGALNHKRAGQCWAFPGASGTFAVELPQAAVPTAVVLEHIATPLTRTPDSAPRRFAVFGRTSARDRDPVKLHSAELFSYDLNQAGTPAGAAQRFELDYAGAPVRVVTLEVVDNWGHEEYTCLYRFRVLVEPAAAEAVDGGVGPAGMAAGAAAVQM